MERDCVYCILSLKWNVLSFFSFFRTQMVVPFACVESFPCDSALSSRDQFWQVRWVGTSAHWPLFKSWRWWGYGSRVGLQYRRELIWTLQPWRCSTEHRAELQDGNASLVPSHLWFQHQEGRKATVPATVFLSHAHAHSLSLSFLQLWWLSGTVGAERERKLQYYSWGHFC